VNYEEAAAALAEVPSRAILRLWRYPSFENWKSWTLVGDFRSPSGLADESARLDEVVWDSTLDCSRFTDPMAGLRWGTHRAPTLRRRSVVVPTDFIEGMLVELSRLQVVVAPDNRIVGLDGTSYGLQTYRSIGGIGLQWWGEHPREWELLRHWHEGALDNFEALLDQAETT